MRVNKTPMVSPERPPSSVRSSPEEAAEAERLAASFRAHADMYRLPGDPPLTERDIARYAKSAAAAEAQLPTAIEQGLQEAGSPAHLALLRMIDQVPMQIRARPARAFLHGMAGTHASLSVGNLPSREAH